MNSDKVIEQLSENGIEYLFKNRGTKIEKTFLIRGKASLLSNKLCGYIISDGKLTLSVFFDFNTIQASNRCDKVNPNMIFKTNKVIVQENFDKTSENKYIFVVKQLEIVAVMRHLIRFYEFLIQVSCFEDVELHKKYLFINYLMAYIDIKHPGGGYNLDGKIKASNFVQKKGEEHKKEKLVPDPIVKLPTAETIMLPEDKRERLSVIIAEINSKTGKSYDNDVAIKAMLQIKDLLMKSDKLRTSAKNNSIQDFEFSYFDDVDDALIEGLSQNQDFFSLLLNNEEIKKQVLGIFTGEIYKSLRAE